MTWDRAPPPGQARHQASPGTRAFQQRLDFDNSKNCTSRTSPCNGIEPRELPEEKARMGARGGDRCTLRREGLRPERSPSAPKDVKQIQVTPVQSTPEFLF